MKTTWLLLNLLIFSRFALAQTTIGLSTPESIVAVNNRYYVSNIGAKLNAEKDNDGFISELTAQGLVKTARFLPTGSDQLHAPKGMAVLNNILYVTDIDRVVGFNLSSRRQVFAVTVPGKATFLNDLCTVNDHTLLVSDTFGNRVLALDLRKSQLTEIATNLAGANGLAYHPKTGTAYVCTMGPNLNGTGKLFRKVLKGNQSFEPIPNSPTGILDGLAVTVNGHLLVSDWQSLTTTQGRMYDFDPVTGQITILHVKVQSPADFWYDSLRQRLWIPSTLTNTLTRFQLPETEKTGQRAEPDPARLYHVGLINGFLGGLYDGVASYQSVKAHGNFGLGAPDQLDGELTVLDGHVYQTQASGRTFEPDDTAQTAYAFVHPFRADKSFTLDGPVDKHALETILDYLLTDPTGLYAIRVSGLFRHARTRAFPPVSQKPYAALTMMMTRQHFFDFEAVPGDLAGYRLPALLSGINIPGYHFHFLAQDKTKGGHVLSFTGDHLAIKIQQLAGYVVDIPRTKAYQQFDFTKDRQAEVKQVESGGKPNE